MNSKDLDHLKRLKEELLKETNSKLDRRLLSSDHPIRNGFDDGSMETIMNHLRNAVNGSSGLQDVHHVFLHPGFVASKGLKNTTLMISDSVPLTNELFQEGPFGETCSAFEFHLAPLSDETIENESVFIESLKKSVSDLINSGHLSEKYGYHVGIYYSMNEDKRSFLVVKTVHNQSLDLFLSDVSDHVNRKLLLKDFMQERHYQHLKDRCYENTRQIAQYILKVAGFIPKHSEKLDNGKIMPIPSICELTYSVEQEVSIHNSSAYSKMMDIVLSDNKIDNRLASLARTSFDPRAGHDIHGSNQSIVVRLGSYEPNHIGSGESISVEADAFIVFTQSQQSVALLYERPKADMSHIQNLLSVPVQLTCDCQEYKETNKRISFRYTKVEGVGELVRIVDELRSGEMIRHRFDTNSLSNVFQEMVHIVSIHSNHDQSTFTPLLPQIVINSK